MTNDDLLAFLRDEESRSFDGTLLSEVETALNSYNGQPYGDEEDGRSQVVARDVAEVVDHMTVSLLKCFVAGDKVVEFEPSSEDQQQAADDATETVAADMRKKGYRLIHDWIKAGLLEKVGVVKTCIEKKKRRVEQEVPAELLPDDLEAAGIIEATPVEGMVDELGEPAMFKVAALVDDEPKLTDYNVPLEEFRFSPDARDLESAIYLAHIVEKSISDLVAMGFDRDTVEGIQGDNPNSSTLAHARDDGRSINGTDRNGALRKVWLLEEYVFFDLDGDGIAERLCVHRVGNTILGVEPCDYQPFEFWTPFPMPGRLVGQSLADKVVDIQRVNTVLERNMLDSLYFCTAPGTYIHEDSIGDHTVDDLLTVRPGRLVRFKGATPPLPEQRNDTSAIAMQAIEFKIGQRESRTGITRMNQGLDADALNKTASGTAMMMSQGQQIEEYLARNFAESLARFFARRLKLMGRYFKPFQIRVDGVFREVDPSQWDEMDVVIRVGLGTGRKDQRLMYREKVIEAQSAALAEGLSIVDEAKIYNSMKGVIADAGLGNVNDFFNDPDQPQLGPDGQPVQKQEKPDPEMMKAQAELQMQQQEAETKAQLKAAELQGKQQEASLKLELMRAEAEERASLERDKAEFERQQAIAQMQFEMELARQKFAHEASLAKYRADNDAELKKYRQGGELDK